HLATTVIDILSLHDALPISCPDSAHKYYIFSLTGVNPYLNLDEIGKLYYSVVDMNRNNGLGDVMPGKKGIFLDSNLRECMTSVRSEEHTSELKSRENLVCRL